MHKKALHQQGSIFEIFEQEAKERLVEAGKSRVDAERNNPGEFVQLSQKIDELVEPKNSNETKATQKAAEEFGTNRQYVSELKKDWI